MEIFAVATFVLSVLACNSRAASSQYQSSVLPLLNQMNSKIDAMAKKIDAIEKVIVTSKAQGLHCADLYQKGYKTDGVYTIDPDGQGAFKVRCDMKTSGGGWTIFQRRVDGSVDFFRYWKDYADGFGNPAVEYWLGLDKINRLTNSDKNIMRIDMEDTTGITKYAAYDSISIASEKLKYRLSLGTYSGTAGNSLINHKGNSFSTRDVDNDGWDKNCAITFKGAWWYANCHSSNLNGYYYLGKHTSYADGVNWSSWKGLHYSLKKTEMKIRPTGFPLNK